MTTTRWTTIGFAGCLIVACGGSVSLGEIGSGVNGTSSGTSGSSGSPRECPTSSCGPALGAPAKTCSDGSIGGNTGKCIANADGSCGWELRECPADPPAACFGKDGTLDASYKKCASDADCVSVDYQVDCCGSMHAAGVSKSSEAAVTACAKTRAAGYPACDCVSKPTVADDASANDGAKSPKAVFCNAVGLCETSFRGLPCGSTACGPSQQCCSGVPFPAPTCVNGVACPISERKHKKDITYLDEAAKRRLAEEVLRIPLATYRYKSQSEDERTHLGFIIDDIAPSAAVTANGERVDMYGYTTMSVAALQLQANEIAELRRQVEELRRELAASRAKK
ncbi:MAG: tail fiber domain-containing protein [Deltaproteobacteria bacterium]|nr:tail fiber domain-containing protein [Deltaproteobacteria bacterium]